MSGTCPRVIPHLKYIELFDKDENGYSSIFIGGSTDTAKNDIVLKPINTEGFEKIKSFKEIDELHNYIQLFKIG